MSDCGCDSGGGDTGGCDSGGGDTGCCDTGGGDTGGCDSGTADSGGFDTHSSAHHSDHHTGIDMSDTFHSPLDNGLLSTSAYPISSSYDDDDRRTYSGRGGGNKYRSTPRTSDSKACGYVFGIIVCSGFVIIFLLVLFLGILS